MVVTNANRILIQLGFSDYESRAYTALLADQPATAYELAKHSGVPSSKIYETVNRLVEKGIFLATDADQVRGKRYCAISVEDFIDRKKAETEKQTDLLMAALKSVDESSDADIIWPLNDEESVYSKAKQIINKSEKTCLISLWPKELEHIQDVLISAQNRGVKIALVHFGQPQVSIGATYYHPVEQTLYEEKGGRGLTVVCDGLTVLIATFFKDNSIQSSWSQNRTFVTVAEDYIRHDVYVTKVTTSMDDKVKEYFGNNYEKMRDIFTA